MKNTAGICLLAATMIAQSCGFGNRGIASDALGVMVSPEENREYSYTDKKAGYWYGTTHQEKTEWWSGWNMAKKRILADYAIGVDDPAIGSARIS